VLGTDPSEGGREWRARIGIVLQSNADASELSVREMIRYFAAYYPDPRDPDEVIEAVGLAEKAGAKLRQLVAGDPATRIVVLTTYETDADILRAVIIIRARDWRS